jgi:hypothetical protein
MKTHVFSRGCLSLIFGLVAIFGAFTAIAQDSFGTVTIHATDGQAAEAFNNTGTFTVRRAGGTNFSQVIFYQLSGTASNGVDYEELGGTVQMPAGATAVSFHVKPIDDSLIEGTETVVARIIESPMMCMTCGYRIGEQNTADVLIEDNDRTGTNSPPFVQLNEPATGDVFLGGSDITLRAYAQDPEDRFYVKVEFFEGANSLGFGTFQPATCPAPYCPYFALTWSNVPPGKYVLRAVATDSVGASSRSNPAEITVLDGVNIYATDAVAAERPLTTAVAPDTATFTVRRPNVETNNAIVVRYEISGTASNGVDYRNLSGEVTIPAGALSAQIVVDPLDDNLSEDTETVILTLIPPCPPCLFTTPPCLPPVPIDGSCYPIGPDNRAVVYIRDNDPVPTNHPPFVELTAPREGETFAAPADITLVAFAQDDEDKYNLQVEFFEGTRSLGFGTFNPTRCWPGCPNYVLTWSNVPPGQYILTAVATDSGGASSVSAPVHITVGSNAPPAVRIIQPSDGEVFPARSDVGIIAFAQDREDHYDLKVEFFEGDRSLGFGTFFPGRCAVCPNYGITWSNVPTAAARAPFPRRCILPCRKPIGRRWSTSSPAIRLPPKVLAIGGIPLAPIPIPGLLRPGNRGE